MKNNRIAVWQKEKCYKQQNGKAVFNEEFIKNNLHDIERNFKTIYLPCDYSCFSDLDDYTGTWLLEHKREIADQVNIPMSSEDTFDFKIPDIVRDIIDKHIDEFAAQGQFVFAPELSAYALPVMLKKSTVYTFSELLGALKKDLGNEQLFLEVHSDEASSSNRTSSTASIDMSDVFQDFPRDLMVSDAYKDIREILNDSRYITLATQISDFTGQPRINILTQIRNQDIKSLKESIVDTINHIGAEDSGYITNALWLKHLDLCAQLDRIAEQEEELEL